MRHQVKLRHIAPPERAALETLTRSRTAEARLVERAKLILAVSRNTNYSAVAREVHVTRHAVYVWIRRFNEYGLSGLKDRPRGGRPATYSSDDRALVIATALSNPKDLALPFGSWTLDRIAEYLKETYGMGISRSRINVMLLEEGLRWRKQETWFGEKVDPDFAEKRGSSKRSTQRHLRIVQ